MKVPGPVAAVTAKISAFEDYHPRLIGAALAVAAALLITSGLRPAGRPGRREVP
jgi:hypothetical protein